MVRGANYAMRMPPDASLRALTSAPSRPAAGARVAVVHDWLDTWGGGEQCLSHILALFPGATLHTLVDFMPDAQKARLAAGEIRTSFLQSLPGARRRFRSYLPLFPLAVNELDVGAYDLVVSSSHAVAKSVRTHRRQLHVCYCYTPMRYAWDLRETYLSQVGLDRGPAAALARALLARLARWDASTARRVDRFVAISRHIARRIRRCYGRDAEVVYPPVDMPAKLPSHDDDGPYVTVSRLVPYKRIDAIVAAFASLPDRELVVVGDGPERARIEAIAPRNVRLVGAVDDATRDAWLERGRAFVYAADEDFGIAPLEAQAHGLPAIVLGSGGTAETIRGLDGPRPTGVHFDAPTPAGIADAIRGFEANADRIASDDCRANALRFSAERFRRELATCIDTAWNDFRRR